MASETILKFTYCMHMDDSLDSVQDGIQPYEQLSKFWGEAGMRTYKWLSNSEAVLNQIPPSDRMHGVNLDSDPLPSTKILGTMWLASEDVFTFVGRMGKQETQWTK